MRFALWAPARRAGGAGARRRRRRAHADAARRRRLAPARRCARRGPATRYRFRLPDGLRVPDPASRFNPDDVHGAERAWSIRAAYDWRDDDWRGRPWDEAVVYELHVGTFTPEGTFAAAVERLDDLAAARRHRDRADAGGRLSRAGATGATTACCRSRPTPSYGTPDDLKALVDAAHGTRPDGAARRGLQPLRPRGQLPARLRPQFFNPQHQTPWGAAINFDGDGSAHGARLLHPQRALLARGVPLRRPAPRRGARDPRRLAAAHRRRDLPTRCAPAPGRERHVHLVLENDAQPGAPASRATRAAARRCAHGAVERRPAPRAARAGHRRADGYYADYAERPRGAVRPRARRGLRLPGRAVAVSRRRAARRADAAACR